ncbi:MAG: hypothetical protein QG580_231 [Patescibacteria group bacterium]|jgi:hypothetical protein|nr:hypothetical protein [Patescibacteria group bacterium]
MRTLIAFALIAIAQMALAQPFFIGSESVIVQNQDGTYSWFENSTLMPITQPEGRIFTWEEIRIMRNGGSVKREKVTENVTRFNLGKFPFLINDARITSHEFEMTGKEIVTAKEHLQESSYGHPLRFWLIIIGLVISLFCATIVPHDSPTTFSLVGIAMILTIIAANYLGWWGYGAGLIATIVAKIKSNYPHDDWGQIVVLAIFFGLLSFPFGFEWSDQESKKLFMVTIASIITITFVVSGLYIWRKTDPEKGGDIEFV